MDVTQAIDYLTRRFINPEQAIRKLDNLQESIGLLKLYRRYFPTEFAAHTLKPVSEVNNLYTALMGFLKLVNQHLFWIPEYIFEEMTDDDGPPYQIPIEPMYEEWWNIDFEEHDLLWQVMLILLGETPPDNIEDEVIITTFKARQEWHGQMIDCDKLNRLCRRQNEPLKGLCMALLAVDHSTGNPWLDATYECPYVGIEWTVRNINYLKKKWLEAGHIQDQIVSLNQWLSKDGANIHELLALYARALVART
jgi:hypothetical protein